MKNFISERSMILYSISTFEELKNNDEINELFRRYYSYEKVDAVLKDITVRSNDGNSEKNFNEPKLKFPTTTSSQAQYLFGEIESVSNQFINSYYKYVTKINETLDLSKKLGTTESKQEVENRIKQKKTQLEDLFKEWKKTFTDNINLFECRVAVQALANPIE